MEGYDHWEDQWTRGGSVHYQRLRTSEEKLVAGVREILLLLVRIEARIERIEKRLPPDDDA